MRTLNFFSIEILCFLLATLTGSTVNSQISNYSEKEISDYIQSLIGGEREVTVKSGRIDLVHNDVAFEIDWANKWKESIGQALWYAQQSNKKPGIILILKKDSDYKYFIQLNSSLTYANLNEEFKVYLFPNDFEKFMYKDK